MDGHYRRITQSPYDLLVEAEQGFTNRRVKRRFPNGINPLEIKGEDLYEFAISRIIGEYAYWRINRLAETSIQITDKTIETKNYGVGAKKWREVLQVIRFHENTARAVLWKGDSSCLAWRGKPKVEIKDGRIVIIATYGVC